MNKIFTRMIMKHTSAGKFNRAHISKRKNPLASYKACQRVLLRLIAV